MNTSTTAQLGSGQSSSADIERVLLDAAKKHIIPLHEVNAAILARAVAYSLQPATPVEAARATESDFEKFFQDACESIDSLTSYPDMLWKWFTERRGSEDMRANASQGGLSADDFKQMLDEHEASIMSAPAQPSGETEQQLRESNLRSLLREARQYVSDAYCDEDHEVIGHTKSLLDDIDQALTISSTERATHDVPGASAPAQRPPE